MKEKRLLIDKLIFAYQDLSQQEKVNLDRIIKVAGIIFSIYFGYQVGSAIGKFIYHLDIEI